MTDKPTATEALKRALAAKKAGKAGGGGAAFKPGQHPERGETMKAAAMAKPAFRKASKRG